MGNTRGDLSPLNLALTMGVRVDRATAALPQSTSGALFTIASGRVLIVALAGEVTTAIQAQANNTKLVMNPTATGASQDLCAVLSITGDAVGETYTISGTVGDALRSDLLIGNAVLQEPLLLPEGDIELDCAASNTGSVAWSVVYVPFDENATLVAA